MKHDERSKLDLFRAARLLLGRKETPLKTGASPDAAARHSAIVDEFRKRVALLQTDTVIVILDKTKDTESPEHVGKVIRDALTRKNMKCALSHAAGKTAPNSHVRKFRRDLRNHFRKKSTLKAEFSRIGEHPIGYCSSHYNPESGVSIAWFMNGGAEMYDALLYGKPSVPLRPDLPPGDEVGREIMYHEVFGHGTESLLMKFSGNEGCILANKELRADIAALAGMCRDTENSRVAKAKIAIRDLGGVRGPEGAVVHANAPILRDVLREVEGRGAEFRKLDDAGLLDFINDAYGKFRQSDEGYARRCRTVRDARILVSHADKSWVQEIFRDMERNHPEDFSEACAHIRDCVESLCFLCEMEPHQAGISPCTLPAPSMRPQL